MTFPSKLADLYDQFDRIEDSGVTAGSQEFVQFLLDCLALIRHRLPNVALEAVDLVSKYRKHHLPVAEISEMAVRCWRDLDNKYKGKDVDVPEVAAIRAVIFLLESLRKPNNKDIADQLQYFLQFVNFVEPHLPEEALLLDKHFPGSITGTFIT